LAYFIQREFTLSGYFFGAFYLSISQSQLKDPQKHVSSQMDQELPNKRNHGLMPAMTKNNVQLF
jgi:hypothetical protein